MVLALAGNHNNASSVPSLIVILFCQELRLFEYFSHANVWTVLVLPLSCFDVNIVWDIVSSLPPCADEVALSLGENSGSQIKGIESMDMRDGILIMSSKYCKATPNFHYFILFLVLSYIFFMNLWWKNDMNDEGWKPYFILGARSHSKSWKFLINLTLEYFSFS